MLRGRRGDSPRNRRPNATQTTPMGTLIQKMKLQSKSSTTAPPMIGPAATPSPLTPPQIPIASSRSRVGTASARCVRESVVIAAPPAPWTTRAAIRAPDVEDSAAPAEASVKSATPQRKTLRRPRRLPRAAAGRMSVASTRVYALTNHWSWVTVASRSPRMSGRAKVMTRLSRAVMRVGSAAATIAQARRPRRRSARSRGRDGAVSAVSGAAGSAGSGAALGWEAARVAGPSEGAARRCALGGIRVSPRLDSNAI